VRVVINHLNKTAQLKAITDNRDDLIIVLLARIASTNVMEKVFTDATAALQASIAACSTAKTAAVATAAMNAASATFGLTAMTATHYLASALRCRNSLFRSCTSAAICGQPPIPAPATQLSLSDTAFAATLWQQHARSLIISRNL